MSPMSDQWKPNVTVAAIVERDGRFLFVEEQTREGLRLNQPAGHLERGESLVDALLREVDEETACRVAPLHLVGVYMTRTTRPARADVTYMRFAFACRMIEEVHGRTLDDGIVRTLWLTPAEIRAQVQRHRSPAVVSSLDDYLAGRRFPIDLVNVHPDCRFAATAGMPV